MSAKLEHRTRLFYRYQKLRPKCHSYCWYSTYKTIASGVVYAHTPVKCVLKHTQPRWHGHSALPRRWHPWPLPHLNTALRMWHHGQVSAVDRTQACNASRASVRIHWIFGRRRPAVICILHRHETLVLDGFQNIWTLENQLPYKHKT